jgi:hypothetical protein
MVLNIRSPAMDGIDFSGARPGFFDLAPRRSDVVTVERPR